MRAGPRMDAEKKIRALCADITPPPAGPQTARTRAPNRLETLAAQMRAVQRAARPAARIKGLALFAADRVGESGSISKQVRGFVSAHTAIHEIARQHDVKLAVVDAGLAEDFSRTELANRMLRERVPARGGSPEEMAWESLHAGVRVACVMKGKGTDVFGLGFIGRDGTGGPGLELENAVLSGDTAAMMRGIASLGAWDLGAAAGFVLGAAHLQTPVVISGASSFAAAELARRLAPAAQHAIIWAQPPPAGGRTTVEAVLDLPWPDEIAVMIALGICESAARVPPPRNA